MTSHSKYPPPNLAYLNASPSRVISQPLLRIKETSLVGTSLGRKCQGTLLLPSTWSTPHGNQKQFLSRFCRQRRCPPPRRGRTTQRGHIHTVHTYIHTVHTYMYTLYIHTMYIHTVHTYNVHTYTLYIVHTYTHIHTHCTYTHTHTHIHTVHTYMYTLYIHTIYTVHELYVLHMNLYVLFTIFFKAISHRFYFN